MNHNPKKIPVALTAVLLAGQLSAPAAALAQTAAAPEGDLNITETFRDPKLQQWLLNGGNLSGAGADGVLTEEERLAVTSLDVSGLGLTSLDGLSAFPNLKTLNCSKNSLTELDLSGNPALESLSCANNQLTELDLSNNPLLRYLNCNMNRLTTLDLSGHSALTALYCEMNLLKTLNISGCEKLQTLYCRNNVLETLDLTDNVELTFIHAFDNQLTTIDVSHLENLQFLHINHNKLTQLDLSNNQKLEGNGFIAQNNLLEKIQLPNQPGLMIQLSNYEEQNPIAGHEKVEWFLDEDCTDPAPQELEAQGQTLYSKRVPNRYTIYFAANGGSGAMSFVSAQWGSELALPENLFTRNGYTFENWSTYPGDDSQTYEDQATVENLAGDKADGDRITLYANWKGNSYTIKLDPNGGQELEQEVEATYGQTVNLPSAPFTNASEDMEFAGWSLMAEGAVRYPDGAAIQNLTAEDGGEVTLYAVWRTSASVLQKPFLQQLEEKYQELVAASGLQTNYTQEDWDALADAYSEAVSAVQAEDEEDNMRQAAEAGCAAMEAIPTLAERIAEVTDGWKEAHQQILSQISSAVLTEENAAEALAQAQQALSDLESLDSYSGLQDETEREQIVGQAAVLLETDAESLRAAEKAATWLASLDGLSLRSPSLVQEEHIDAYQTALSQQQSLAEEVAQTISQTVEQALTQRLELASQKRSETVSLQEAYDSLDLSLYSIKGQTALSLALDDGLEAIRGASTVDEALQARKEAVERMNQVPTAEEETEDPPAPPVDGGDDGDDGDDGAGGDNGNGGGGGTDSPEVPETPAEDQVTVVTDDKTGASAVVTTTPEGKVSAVVTVPEGVDAATIRIPCEANASTVAVLVGKDGSRKVIPYAVFRDGKFAVRLEESANIELVEVNKDFSDVKGGAWYDEAVQFASGRELFVGMGDGVFAPSTKLSRAMAIAVLHRLEGSPAPAGTDAFTDVSEDAWYAAAANWAAEQSITSGVSENRFEPESTLTREMLAQLLYHCAGAPATNSNAAARFSDAGSVSDWAEAAMQWACENGLFVGDGQGRLRPQAECTRAEAAVVLARFVEYSLQ